MAGADDQSCDFYAVLGLKKECTAIDLKNAYKKLALKWHPDRCSASGSLKYVEEAKKKFQAIQQAYSVLSDGNKRFLYDVGVYDCNDDNDENGMGDFLSEMATMMTQNQPNENRNESFEDLQDLFEEMFQSDIEFFGSSSRCATPSSCSSSSSQPYCGEKYSISNKRNSSEMSEGSLRNEAIKFDGFSVGAGGMSGKHQGGEGCRRKNTTRKCRK